VVTETMRGRSAPLATQARGRADNAVGVPGQWRPRSIAGSPTATTVLVADPDRETRRTLTNGLLEAGVGRVIEADSASAVDDILRAGGVGHLALLSLAFGTSSIRLIQGLREASWARVIALAPTADIQPVLGAINAGACGVLRGRPGAEAEIPDLARALSARELEVLGLVADGQTNKRIAEELSLSALTVKSHLARISRKLGTGDRSHLVAIAMRAGVLA
jgi:DNA-binding NarL/FixJ family response regulator